MDKIIMDLSYCKATRQALVYGINQRANAAFVGLYLLKTDLHKACHGENGLPMNLRVTIEEIKP